MGEKTIVMFYLPNIRKLTVWTQKGHELPGCIKYVPFSTEPSSQTHTKYVYRSCQIPISSASSFRVPSAASIACSACGCLISKHGVQLRELPSKYWMELVDCWSCHQSEFAMVSERLKMSTDGSEILPNAGFVLYRGLFMVAYASDFMLSETGRCVCDEVIGEPISATTSHTRLFLDKVRFVIDTHTIVEPPSRLTLLMNELFDVLEFHSTSSIRICSVDSNLTLRLDFLARNAKVSLDQGHVWKDCCIVSSLGWEEDKPSPDLSSSLAVISWPSAFLRELSWELERVELPMIVEELMAANHLDNISCIVF